MLKKTSVVFMLFAVVIFAQAQETKKFSLKNSGNIETLLSSNIQQSPWGMQFNTFPFHSNTHYEDLNIEQLLKDAPILIEKISEMGIKWARVSVDWPSVEDRNGVFHFELLDYTLKALKEKGITTYLCFNNGHPLHTDGIQNPMVSETATKAWLNFVEVLVKRYKNEVDYWELWNEFNYKTFKDKSPSISKDYFELVKASAPVIRKNDPGCKVLCTGVARFDVPFMKELFDHGIAEYIDVVQVHPYNEIPEASILNINRTVKTPKWYMPASNKAEELIELVRSSGKDLEIWQGECGYPSTFNSRGWNGNGPYSETIQAKWILRRGLTDLSYGANVSAYFVFREQTGINNPSSVNSKGLMYHDSFDVKEGYYTYQNMCSVLTGKFEVLEKGVPDLEVIEDGSFSSIKKKNFYSLKLKNDSGKLFYCYWLPVRIQDKIILGKINLTLNAKDFKEPLLLNLLTGEKFKPTEQSKIGDKLILKGLPVGDFPFVIVENK